MVGQREEEGWGGGGRKEEEGENGKKTPRPHLRKRGEEGGQVVEKESRGCKGYPEGTDCSGVRRGCCQHTPGARRTHAHMRPGPGPKCVNGPANCTPTTHATSHLPTAPKGPIWNQSTAANPVPSWPCCRPCPCWFHQVRHTGWLSTRHKDRSHTRRDRNAFWSCDSFENICILLKQWGKINLDVV